MLTKIRRQFRDKPWLFVVFGLGLMVGLTITFLVIAINNPPQLILAR